MSCCQSCYLLCTKIPDCLINLKVINSNLTIGQQVTVKIKDKFDNIWKQDIIVAADKSVLIDLMNSWWKAHILNPFAGEFDISIEKDGAIIVFTVAGVDYDCLRTSVESVTPKLSTYTIEL